MTERLRRDLQRHLGPMPQFASKGRAWTEAEYAKVVAMRNAGAAWRVIAVAMDRPEHSCVKYYHLRIAAALDGEAKVEPIGIKAPWPEHARFDGRREHRFKPSRVPPILSIPPAFGFSEVGNAAALCVTR